MDDKQGDSLIDEIQSAFVDNRYPGDDQLTIYDPSGREYDSTHHVLRGKSWKQISVSEFLAGDTPVADLTAHAFHYYLPAFLLESLSSNTQLSASLVNTLIFYLSPSRARATGEFAYDDTKRFFQRIALLSAHQKRIVARVLREYVARGWADEEEIEEAVECLQTVRKGQGRTDPNCEDNEERN